MNWLVISTSYILQTRGSHNLILVEQLELAQRHADKFSKCSIMLVCLMVFNATFNNILVISWWSVCIGVHRENHRPVASH